MRKGVIAAGAALAAAFAAHAYPVLAEDPGKVSETLLDRLAIENLLASYYYDYHDLGAEVATRYFTAEAVYDANGVVMRGREEIAALYQGIADTPPVAGGATNMLMAPPKIEVNGRRATATTVWTLVKNDTLTAPPRLLEQGHEYDVLVKEDDTWRIVKRVVVTDSGLPPQWQATYVERPADYDPFAEE